MRTIHCLFIGLLLVGNFGGASATVLRGPLDVNDVSYLWPPVYKKDASEAQKLIGLSPVIPRGLFEEITAFAQGQELQGQKLASPVRLPPESVQIDNWKIVSMRIDPCAPGLRFHQGNLNHCIQEVRLVAQPIFFNGIWEYYDFAFHIIFEVSRGTPRDSALFAQLLEGLVELKEQNRREGQAFDTNGVPLKIHPGFRREGFRLGLQSLLMTGLKSYHLKKITFIGADSHNGPWVFFQGLVSNGHYQLESDVNLQGKSHGHIIPELPGRGGQIEPVPTNQAWPFAEDNFLGPSIRDLFVVGQLNPQQPARLPDHSESKVLKLEDLVQAFSNPRITDRTNTDCFSCHASMSRELMLKLPMRGPFSYTTANNHVSLGEVAVNESITNFRTFGWFGPTPIISKRVIFESAEVVDLLEKQF